MYQKDPETQILINQVTDRLGRDKSGGGFCYLGVRVAGYELQHLAASQSTAWVAKFPQHPWRELGGKVRRKVPCISTILLRIHFLKAAFQINAKANSRIYKVSQSPKHKVNYIRFLFLSDGDACF